MDQRQKLFIYDRKEMAVLVLLGIMVALFAFTLGVHLGKRVGSNNLAEHAAEATPAQTVADAIPDRQDFVEQSDGVANAVDETLNQALHEEVARTGIKLDTPRQVELPTETVSKNAGATDLGSRRPEPSVELKAIAAASRPSPNGKFTLQVGSHRALTDAKEQIEALESLGEKPFLRPVMLEKKGKWYRVYVGGFESSSEAERAGEMFKSKQVIDSYLVANMIP